jgi:hypothetical protein
VLTLIEGFPDNVLALDATGEVTADDYRTVLVPALEERLQRHHRLRLLYRLGEAFAGYSAGAAWEDAKIGMRHFTHFERIAVITDVDWIENAVRAFGFALPGDVRVYDNDETDEANAWLLEPGDPGELEFELDETRSLLILEPRDELEAGDFDRVAGALDPYLATHGKLSGVVIVARSFPGWDDFAGLLAHLGFVREHHEAIDRVAVVTDSRFLGAMPRIAGVFLHAEIQRFAFEDRSVAEDWAAGKENL